MASSEIGTSTGNSFGGKYQVFLNFRGLDTRRTFTDSLYHALLYAGICVFLDDEELQVGERIGDNLLQAIDNSKLYIPIFSKNYASSHWCLDELARMVENTKSKEDGRHILPIFYDVKPDDVKLKTELYNEAISNLQQQMKGQKNKFSSDDIKTWQQALNDVCGNKGWELDKYKGYTELIKAIVDRVTVILKTREKKVIENIVGMEDQVAAVKKLLDIDSGDVRLIGIYGMSGIGKTTLAKIIFNQLCDRFGRNCSFLDDVKEFEKNKGLVELQKKLLSDISHYGVAPEFSDDAFGTNTIEETICRGKMLIVLDDVDGSKQIQKLIGGKDLCPGTRILVTTRDKSALTIKRRKFEEYEMKQLSEENALKLFSRHAFDGDSPPEKYYILSRKIVSTADGLPLALEAIGSSLFGEEEEEIWKEWLDKLKKTPHEDVLGKLKLSYDTLERNQQQIFLDVACFFIGENKTNPVYVWKDCDLFPESAIKVLTKRCMIKFLDDDKFGMHDQFRNLGRNIARDEGTRLWNNDDFLRKLKSTECQCQGKRPIVALRLKSRGGSSESPIIVTSEQIKRSPQIRFLWLCEVICQGDFTGCLSELKWIDLDYSYGIPPRRTAPDHEHFQATSSLHLKDVVVVNISGVDIAEDVLKNLINGAKKLKVLTLCYNTSIHGTPTFPRGSVLEKLAITKFMSLMEIDCSIGKLTMLTHLSFEFCVELKKLPEQIGELLNLQHLSLRHCDSLRELPNSILNLKSLKKLDVLGTRITRLPDSIDKLPNLSSVNVSFTSIEKLPSTMNQLLHLQTLQLNPCNRIQELPELPRSLTTLQLTSASLVTVPNLSYLTNLVELALSDGSTSLAKSNIIQTCDLQWIGSLSRLSKLQFCFSNVCVSTIQLGSLSLLEKLTLHGLDVPAFEQLPSELMVLELYDTRGKQIQFPLSEENTAIVSSSSKESGESKVLRQLEFTMVEGHESKGSVYLPKPGCNELQAPELIDHWGGDFHFPSSLNMLRKLVLWGCPGVQDIQFVPALEFLFVFAVGGCASLKRLGGLSNLKYLMELSLNWCPSLQVVEGIDELEFLHELKIDECRSVERILDPSSSKIPKNCSVLVTRSGKLPDCGRTLNTWESYREKILNGTEIETTDSETETRDSPLRLYGMVKLPQWGSMRERTDTETEERESFDFYF